MHRLGCTTRLTTVAASAATVVTYRRPQALAHEIAEE